jgi:hypothetical protein
MLPQRVLFSPSHTGRSVESCVTVFFRAMVSLWRITLSAILVLITEGYRPLRLAQSNLRRLCSPLNTLNKNADTVSHGVPFTLRSAGDVRKQSNKTHNTHFHSDQKRKYDFSCLKGCLKYLKYFVDLYLEPSSLNVLLNWKHTPKRSAIACFLWYGSDLMLRKSLPPPEFSSYQSWTRISCHKSQKECPISTAWASAS